MTDIVERLVSEVTVESGTVTPLRREAAAEIEFLRAQMDAIREMLPPAREGVLKRRLVAQRQWHVGDEIEVEWKTPDLAAGPGETRSHWRKGHVAGVDPLTVEYLADRALHTLNRDILTRRPPGDE